MHADSPALIVLEDDHLLVINKPAGVNTHAPSPFAGEGLYEWLRDREERWAHLAILHRLDKETSGLIVFGKSAQANASLTQQFAARTVQKRYLLHTDRPVPATPFLFESDLIRAGDKYVTRPPVAGSVAAAQTRFHPRGSSGLHYVVEAEPLTGRTHQIRVHAAAAGFPILGDELYGGTPAARVYLQAIALTFLHPVTAEPLMISVQPHLDRDARLDLRLRLINPSENTTYRLVHGAGDDWPGHYVDRLGEILWVETETLPTSQELERLQTLLSLTGTVSIYHKLLNRQVRQTQGASARLVSGSKAPESFLVRENNLVFELRLSEGYSFGLFLDQRDNRRRLLKNYVGRDFSLFEQGASQPQVLNTFAYTCAFSVAAAVSGARVTSIDLSPKYLTWGRQNFSHNNLDPSAHEFLIGDVFDWLKRLSKKKRQFDLVLLDPPTFSTSKVSGAFRAEKDYGGLVKRAVPLISPGGFLFASCNAARLLPEDFVATVIEAVEKAGRQVIKKQYVPQPPDFPITRAEPAYLKTLWLQLN